MPYAWNTEDRTSPDQMLRLWPHSSLPRRGFAAFVLATFMFISLPLYAVIGTMVLWGLLPFALAAVGGIWWALERSYTDRSVIEELTLTGELVRLERHNPRGPVQEWECNPYWARVELHASGGPVPNYVTLTGSGREVEIGAFLSEDERKALYGDLSDRLRLAARP